MLGIEPPIINITIDVIHLLVAKTIEIARMHSLAKSPSNNSPQMTKLERHAKH